MTEPDPDWYGYECKSGDILFYYNKTTGEHRWAGGDGNTRPDPEPVQVAPDWYGYECKSGQILFYFNKTTGEHRWVGGDGGFADGKTIKQEPLQCNKVISQDTEDCYRSNGCTYSYIDKNTTIKKEFGIKTEIEKEEGSCSHELGPVNPDWYGYECKSGQILFYYNKTTGEHRWAGGDGEFTFSSSERNIKAETSDKAKNVGMQPDECGYGNIPYIASTPGIETRLQSFQQKTHTKFVVDNHIHCHIEGLGGVVEQSLEGFNDMEENVSGRQGNEQQRRDVDMPSCKSSGGELSTSHSVEKHSYLSTLQAVRTVIETCGDVQSNVAPTNNGCYGVDGQGHPEIRREEDEVIAVEKMHDGDGDGDDSDDVDGVENDNDYGNDDEYYNDNEGGGGGGGGGGCEEEEDEADRLVSAGNIPQGSEDLSDGTDNTSNQINKETVLEFDHGTTCELCGIQVKTNEEYFEHLKTHCKEESSNCPVCKRGFRKRSYLISHLLNHTGYSLDKEGKDEEHSDNVHINDDDKDEDDDDDDGDDGDDGDDDYVYDYDDDDDEGANDDDVVGTACNDDINDDDVNDDNDDGNVHRQKQNFKRSEKPHKCQDCGKAFKLKHQLKTHTVVHKDVQPYKCDYCDKQFKLAHHLRSHRRIHTGEKPYKCKFCAREFSHYLSLRGHETTHTKEKPHKCEECGKAFGHYSNFTTHKRIHKGIFPHECELCGKRFREKSGLRGHERMHTGVKPYQCKECKKYFSSTSALRTHERIHSGIKPYVCGVCTRAFLYNVGLRSHVRRSHTREKPFECKQCGKSFFDQTAATEHERVHTGVKPFKCDVCGVAYTRSRSLRRHKLSKSHVPIQS